MLERDEGVVRVEKVGREKVVVVVGGSLDCLPGLRRATVVLRSGGLGWGRRWILREEMVERHLFGRWRVRRVGFIIGMFEVYGEVAEGELRRCLYELCLHLWRS